MFSIDAVALMRKIRKQLSTEYSKMSRAELLQIHAKFPEITWEENGICKSQTRKPKGANDKAI